MKIESNEVSFETHLDQKLGQCQNFAEAFTAPIRDSYDGIRQLAKPINIDLPEWPASQVSYDSASGKLGVAAGSLAEFWLVNETVGKLSGIGRLTASSSWTGEALKMGIAGGTLGFLQPVSDGQPFIRTKVVSTMEGFSSMAVFGAALGSRGRMAVMGRSGRSALGDAFTYSAAGAASGFVGAEVQSLGLSGRLANWSELKSQVAAKAGMGVGLAGLNRATFSETQIAVQSFADSAAILKNEY